MYKKQVFTNADYEAMLAEEAAWELTLPSGSRIISKTITEADATYAMTVVYMEGA
jgi:hypothetical protein